LLLAAAACSTAAEKTGIDVPMPTNKAGTGALTGAAVGGGLGLLVGSTSGNAGEGLLVGSLAGGTLGAGIGAKIQHDEDKTAMDSKRSSVIQQNERIQQQNQELQELRRKGTDQGVIVPPSLSESNALNAPPIRTPGLSGTHTAKAHPVTSVAASSSARASLSRPATNGIVYLSRPSGLRRATPYRPGSETASIERTSAQPALRTASVRSVPASVRRGAVVPRSSRVAERSVATTVARKTVPVAASTSAAPTFEKTAAVGLPPAATEAHQADLLAKETLPEAAKAPKDLGNCKDALKEAERGLNASSDADRLFYLRRAARLCPTEPSYHVELGKLYGTIGKNDDAKYELRQAIDLDPNNQVARDELSIIENSGTVTR
jgi:hypothetical protein